MRISKRLPISSHAQCSTPAQMTFFARFQADILARKKTITIRDSAESHYQVGSIVDVFTLESHVWFCQLEIKSVTAITIDELNQTHAQQENMSLEKLRQVIQDIYPNEKYLYVIDFKLV